MSSPDPDILRRQGLVPLIFSHMTQAYIQFRESLSDLIKYYISLDGFNMKSYLHEHRSEQWTNTTELIIEHLMSKCPIYYP